MATRKREVDLGMWTRITKAFAIQKATEDSSHAPEIKAAWENMEAHLWRTLIDGWREAGESDRQIGAALGITGQAVNKRWPRRTPGAPGNEYSNGRV